MKRTRIALVVAVGLVLADSSVVVLALPEIYRQLDVSVSEVTWVLVAFNLVLAAAALPAAMAARRLGPARVTCAGLIVFGLASLACGLAGEIELCSPPAVPRPWAGRRPSAARSSCCRR